MLGGIWEIVFSRIYRMTLSVVRGWPDAPGHLVLMVNPGGRPPLRSPGHAQIIVAAPQALAVNKKAMTANRVKGGRPSHPGTWKPAADRGIQPGGCRHPRTIR
jgi:hypothetical protein